MDALFHARSSASKWGGDPDEYLAIHEWLDESGKHVNDYRHRAMRHHSLGIADAVVRFGRILTISTGKGVSVKAVAERHIIEDLGAIPSVSDWVRTIQSEPWMRKRIRTISF